MFGFGKKKELKQQEFDFTKNKKKLYARDSKTEKRITKDMIAKLGAISNHLKELEEKAKEAHKIEGVPKVRKRIYRAKQYTQSAINVLQRKL